MVDFNSLSYYEKVTFIFQCLNAFLGLIGITSNILGIIVFRRVAMRKYSYSFYCVIMAFSDMVILLHSYRRLAAFVFGSDLDVVSTFFCKIDEYTADVAAIFSLWMLTLISFDRLFTVVYPNRFLLIKKRGFQALIVALILVYSLAVNLTLPINYQIVNYSINPFVSIKYCYLNSSANLASSVIISTNFILAIVLINNVINVKMVVFIASSRRRLADRLGQAQLKSSSIKDRKFAVCSIGLNLTCMILKLPLIICLLAVNSMGMNLYQIQLLFTVVGMIYWIDNGASFFINLVVNSLFYEELLVMLRIRKESIASMSTRNS